MFLEVQVFQRGCDPQVENHYPKGFITPLSGDHVPKHMSLWGPQHVPDNGTYPRWVSPMWEEEYSSWATTVMASLEALACYHIHTIYGGFSYLICFLSTKSQTSYQVLNTDSGPVLGCTCTSIHDYSDTRSYLCHRHCLSPLGAVTWESPWYPQRWCFTLKLE